MGSEKKKKVRIVGGKHKGAVLSVEDDLVKPTPDRVRETLFNWLSPHIEKSMVLDLFGGSGCLSFESISRGSDSALYVDSSKKACGAFKDSLVRYRINDIRLACRDSVQMIQEKNTHGCFGIIFIDPPYGKFELSEILEKLYENNWANDDSLIYLESNRCLKQLASTKYQLVKDSVAGNVYYGILKSISAKSEK
ncbi:16S rRNA (guanine(966)-N(2))-methyltransferase RsmD [Gammaproteobacteria bacterium]|nr:16S rRNA (guanine(966)-N(2))-methyltransferase RsmD [Gammaproteobacteria bacterium]